MKPLKLSTIQEQFPGLITDRVGDDCIVSGVGSMDHFGPQDLVFWERKDTTPLLQTSPAVVATSRDVADKMDRRITAAILICRDVKLAQAMVRQQYDDVDLHQHEWPRIHPSAVVHESVTVPDSTTIGPGAVVGRGVKIGQRVVVQTNAVVEHDAEIGDDVIIHARVFVGDHCRIGRGSRIKPGTVIGGEGFGFAPDDDKHYHRIPHSGIVVIEEDVVIGANCNIDRGTYHQTRIARGTRIDALCHIAHNVFIDEDCIITAQAAIAGSSHLGKRVLASGQTGILDHITITDDVVLVHRAGVTEDITEPGMYATTPPQPFREYSRNIATFRKLFELRQRVSQLEKQVKALTDSNN